VKTKAKRACPVCDTLLPDSSEACPVCALQGALQSVHSTLSSEDEESGQTSRSPAAAALESKLRFEHYHVLGNEDGTPVELGRGAMGITYKAFDVHLHRPVALKSINVRLIGDASARRRFVREARAAASVRDSNVASVFHLGESHGDYFYVMEFVDGETLEELIRRSGRLEPNMALEIIAQVAAGMTAIHKKNLVHRDIKPSNIMVSLEQRRLESVKIIDLGLAKGVADDGAVSAAGSFSGTPSYASPEQLAGIGGDIRSDLYSLGITLWEMLSGEPPFQGSASELVDQHQNAVRPIDKLKNVPQPVIVLLEILIAKDPGHRFQNPSQCQRAVTRVKEALSSGSRLNPKELRSIDDRATGQSTGTQQRAARHFLRWPTIAVVCLTGLLLGWFYYSANRGSHLNQRGVDAAPAEKSIAVLPFESLSPNKDDTYFADGVQDEILNNLAKIVQLKVASRTSVMRYRPDSKRDLRQIANALGVANVLEGTIRRDGKHMRVSIELVDAQNDKTIWADSYDRDLIDLFAIQSEIAQTIADKLAAALSPEEKQRIETKPTENPEAYDLYLRAKALTANAQTLGNFEAVEDRLVQGIDCLQEAVRLDPKFALAYTSLALAEDGLMSPDWRASADAAIGNALRLQPDLPEVRLAYANHLAFSSGDDERARIQLAIVKRTLANNPEAILLEAFLDQMQGNWKGAVERYNELLALDPGNSVGLKFLALTLSHARQYRSSEQAFDRLIRLLPDQPTLHVDKAFFVNFRETGDDTALHSAIAALPPELREGRGALSLQLVLAAADRDWQQLNEVIEKMNGGEENGDFAYADTGVPAGCYSILRARLQGERPDQDSSSTETRERLSEKIQKSPGNPSLLSTVAIVDALLGKKQDAIAEAERASSMVREAWSGIPKNVAVVYAWTGELDHSFEILKKIPFGIHYGELKLSPFWDPLRKDARFDKLLAELAPKE
jgi:serine/threonine protein kinase/cytochrome c-type biogenesis protein CcmH/NrfG